MVIYKKLPITLNPYQLYMLISREYPESFLLESMGNIDKLARFSFIGFKPKKHITVKKNVFRADEEEEDTNNPLHALASHIPKIKIEKNGFSGGAVGYVSYDYTRNSEIRDIQKSENNKTKDDLNFPDFEFGIFEDCIIYEHRDKSINYLSHSEDRSPEILALAKEKVFFGAFEAGNIKTNMDETQFTHAVEIAKEHIINGNIFQVVLSRRYELQFEGNLLRFYNYLKQINPSPYMYFLSFGERKIIGTSPENLVRVEGKKIDSYATLAGTRPRGKTLEEDLRLERELLNDEKERAEHLMLVDLTRNDVGKIAWFGSVKVPEFMGVHKYSHVQHLSSHIIGELADGKDCFDTFNALFPAGTLTGAPKIRAMEIIQELEPNQRGVYGGAVGYFSFNGNCDFAIAIRTLVAQKQKAYVQGGAGIVYDSVPKKEFMETEDKMRALLSALEIKF